MVPERTILRLLDRIYAASLDVALWQPFLKDLANALSAEVGSLHLGYSALPDEALRVTCGWDAAFQSAFQVYVRDEPQLFDPVYSIEPGRFRDVEALLPDGMLVESRMYNEWLGPQRLCHFLAGTLHRSRSRIFGLGLMGPRSFGARLDLLRALGPHLQRAVQVQDAVGVAELSGARAEQTLEALRVGVIVTDASGRVLFANRAAQAILAQRDGLAVSREGLHTALSEQTAILRRLIGEASIAGVGGEPGAGGVMALSRPSSRRPFTALVSALRSGQTASLCLSGGAALVLVRDPEELPEAPDSLLSRVFGLTPAEARVAMRVARGECPQEISDSFGVGVPTVRTQLAESLAKTGARRQADLVRLVLAVAGPVAAAIDGAVT